MLMERVGNGLDLWFASAWKFQSRHCLPPGRIGAGGHIEEAIYAYWNLCAVPHLLCLPLEYAPPALLPPNAAHWQAMPGTNRTFQ
jgi:hypothetical protein